MRRRDLPVVAGLILLFVTTLTFGVPKGESEGSDSNFAMAEMYERPASIARADLLACEQLDSARSLDPQDVDVEELADLLTGTWVRQVTWHGVPIPTESAIYFNLRDGKLQSGVLRGKAFMFDQSNLGKGSLTRKVEHIRDSSKFFETPTITFVDCDYDVLDQYFKISDDFDFGDLQVRPGRLHQVWNQLVSTGFFDYKTIVPAHLTQRAGGELFAPSRVGVMFAEASLAQKTYGGHKGARLHLVGEYRGSHAGFNLGEGADGEETADFVKEGNVYVSRNWETDCDEFLELPVPVNWERTVINPGR